MVGGGKTKRPSGVKKHDQAPRESSASYKEASAIHRLLFVKTPEVTPGCIAAVTPPLLSRKCIQCTGFAHRSGVQEALRQDQEHSGMLGMSAAPSRHVAASGGLCGVTPGRRDVPGISWVEAGALLSTLPCPGKLFLRSDPLQTSIAGGCDEEALPRAEPPRVDPMDPPSNRPAFVEGKLRSRVRKGLAQTGVVAKTAQRL